MILLASIRFWGISIRTSPKSKYVRMVLSSEDCDICLMYLRSFTDWSDWILCPRSGEDLGHGRELGEVQRKKLSQNAAETDHVMRVRTSPYIKHIAFSSAVFELPLAAACETKHWI